MEHIRNFSIIAHVDHGKSTLADRMLEHTGTVPERKMRAQVLDAMELERERGITIKMTPVRMIYHTVNHTETLSTKSEILNKSGTGNHKSQSNVLGVSGSDLGFADSKHEYVLNLIDTPGHIDFSYEVSRALKAVEGALLLVDATQGVEAQTLSVLDIARELDLTIIPVVTKIDSPQEQTEKTVEEIAKLLSVSTESVMCVSGKTGDGVTELLEEIVKRVPPPAGGGTNTQALVFDLDYSDHRGVIVHARVFSGELKKQDNLCFAATDTSFRAGDVGVFMPQQTATDALSTGSIGYIVTGIKEPDRARVGDTILGTGKTSALPGYRTPEPVVWASMYPPDAALFARLKQALERLRLTDAALSYEEEASGILGRGFRVGFLGMLHLEIITERMRREFGIDVTVTTPTVAYTIVNGTERETVYTPAFFPDHGDKVTVLEPWIAGEIIARADDVGTVMQLLHNHEAQVGASEALGSEKVEIQYEMPLRELYRNFFDELKSSTGGFASLGYRLADERPADVVRLDIVVADEVVPSLARVVSRARVETEARRVVEKLKDLLPRQLFAFKVQAQALGRIIASETVKASRKDVTGALYGGDVTRKRKLLEKQKKGKKKLAKGGSVQIPPSVFSEIIKP